MSTPKPAAYEVASDGSDYRRYLDGADAPTPEHKQPWPDTLRAWAEQGRDELSPSSYVVTAVARHVLIS
ncbi:MAG: hypothetical protein JO266_14810 [Acidobacteria bacterium]|nr:hypothetical protein [Pseudonocardiales bacterium]MBV8893216.1 hypothetical protein [Acidobacteriota bacterium]MBV9030265.1 hypothetical protein [Pseudonocardiales bacterium]